MMKLHFLPMLGILILSSHTSASPLLNALDDCRKIIQENSRLACYDTLDIVALQEQAAPRFQGKRTEKTEIFTVNTPTRMRYKSDGAIFVLALHRENGDVVQNLHIGGSGEDSYLIEQPGQYFLRVNGSTTWKIWLEEL